MNADLQTKLTAILALCQQVRETRAKMTPGKWDAGDVFETYPTDIIAPDVPGEGSPNVIAALLYDKGNIKESQQAIADAAGIALEHNVSLALVETTEAAIEGFKRGYEMSDYKPEKANCLENLIVIADIWQKLGLI